MSLQRLRGTLGSAASIALFVALGGGLLWHETHIGAQSPAGPAISAPAVDSPANQAAKSHANELSSAFRSASATILPSVVTIETTTKSRVVRSDGRRPRGMEGFGGRNPFEGTPFEQYFDQDQLDQLERQFENRRTPRQSGAGSGVIIDKAGVILTNNHVVNGADVVTVRLADGREFKATEIKTDPQTDLAVLKINGAGDLTAAKLGNSDALEIGDWVIAVGNPFGLEQTVSAGIISGKGRHIGAAQRANFLQTDAAINPGNSGGPLVNLEGEVVGINTAIASNGGGNDGIGFAVPANLAKWVAPQLLSGGTVERAYLGVGIELMSQELADKFGVQRGEGVLVTEVHSGSPAADAGLQEGDVILAFNGTKVHDPRGLQEVVERSVLNTKQKAEVLRDGKKITVEVTARALPKDFGVARMNRGRGDEPAPGKADTAHDEGLGLEVADVSSAEARQLGFGDDVQGVVISNVAPDSPAQAAGLSEGMLIRKVGKTEVRSAAEFGKAVAEQPKDEGVLLLVRIPEGGNRFVVVERQ
ncbi:MAG: Do family serine endopeptidase [Planctomycetaceae bacterium]|nr:Do family serine endopeptidase [Planctomycetaceae bacterium]